MFLTVVVLFFAAQAGQAQVRGIGTFLTSWGLLIFGIILALFFIIAGILIFKKPDNVGTWEYVSEKIQQGAGAVILVALGVGGVLAIIVFGIFGQAPPA